MSCGYVLFGGGLYLNFASGGIILGFPVSIGGSGGGGGGERRTWVAALLSFVFVWIILLQLHPPAKER